ncbi:MAG: PAAR domain-containing protein [Caldilineaceae bacterium]|nr:PAAR domain-containing protein [Caldilineaceae bacterium]
MAQPAAKQGDRIVATDTHIVMIPSPGGPAPTPLPHPFTGIIDGSLSSDVNIEGKPAATQGSTATNTPAHIPQGGPFQKPPANRATIQLGSGTVLINGKPAARNGDTAITCNDPADLPAGTVIAVGTVLIGG